MPIHTNVSIEINGIAIPQFSRFVLEQKVNAHHKFSIVVPISFELMNSAMEKAQSFVGGKTLVTITPAHFSTGDTLQFRGIVSETKLIKGDGSSGAILVNGFSTTFQMEGIPDTMSFNDKKLSEIANEIISRYPQDRLEPKVNLEEDDSLHYTVQYNESDFQFLARMAAKKAVWFYYNGRELIFGKPESKTIPLTYGSGLNSFNFEMRTKPVRFSYYGYDPSESMNEVVSSSEVTPQFNTVTESLFNHSKSFYPSEANVPYNNPIKEGELRNHLSSRIKAQTLSQVSDLLTISGNSDNPAIRIGDIVTINDPGFSVNALENGIQAPKNYGSFYVTDIMHACDESGNYYNEFRGITSDAECPPYGNVHSISQAEIQSGIVVENHDPKGLSRIQVQFPWQKRNGSTTPFLRVTTPYAGGGKGFHVIPEIGEEVLVEFEGGNPEKPVVIGAMFHGQGKSGHGGAGNYMKGFQTASGNKIILNDKDGSIFVSNGNGCGSINIDSAGNITIHSCENIYVTAGKDIQLNAGKNILMNAQENVDIVAKKNIYQTALENDIFSIASKNILEFAMEENISMTAFSKDVELSAFVGKLSQLAMDFAIDAIISGKIGTGVSLNVNGGSITDVKGAIVKIN